MTFVCLVGVLYACATSNIEVELHSLLIAPESRGHISTRGVLYVSGSIVSLYPSGVNPNRGLNGECAALIIDNEMRETVSGWNGESVSVSGRIMSLSAIRDAIPNHSGTVDGRVWSGSTCDTNIAVYVQQMSPS